MRIHNNQDFLFAWRSFSAANRELEGSIGRLSSGVRVGSAADDAAGLGISQRLRTQFIGLGQARRNALDGISLLQTAEGALSQIGELLQRGRELSIQAGNGIYTAQQKQSVQIEVDHILAEINRISDMTTFNGRLLLTASGSASALASTIQGLRSGWLRQSETVIFDYYGLTGDSTQVTISLENGSGKPAWITGTPGIGGKLDGVVLHLNVNEFGAGASAPKIDNDRKVARALTEAILARSTNYVSLDKWFISGSSDFIAGANEMLFTATNTFGASAIVNAVDSPWVDDLLHQASGYAAVKYLNSKLTAAGATMKDVMGWLKGGNDLNTALSFTIGMDVATFIGDFKANGAAFLNNLVTTGALTNGDVGGIRPGTNATVIPDGGVYSVNPLTGFSLQWRLPPAEDMNLVLQVGANQGQTLSVLLPQIHTASLNLLGIDLIGAASDATERFSKALTTVTSARSLMGSTINQLDHTINAIGQAWEASQASDSRIIDLDFAREATKLAREQLLVSSSGAMLAQANMARQNLSLLLKAVGGAPR